MIYRDNSVNANVRYHKRNIHHSRNINKSSLSGTNNESHIKSKPVRPPSRQSNTNFTNIDIDCYGNTRDVILNLFNNIPLDSTLVKEQRWSRDSIEVSSIV
jgi:hypothetical protein